MTTYAPFLLPLVPWIAPPLAILLLLGVAIKIFGDGSKELRDLLDWWDQRRKP